MKQTQIDSKALFSLVKHIEEAVMRASAVHDSTTVQADNGNHHIQENENQMDQIDASQPETASVTATNQAASATDHVLKNLNSEDRSHEDKQKSDNTEENAGEEDVANGCVRYAEMYGTAYTKPKPQTPASVSHVVLTPPSHELLKDNEHIYLSEEVLNDILFTRNIPLISRADARNLCENLNQKKQQQNEDLCLLYLHAFNEAIFSGTDRGIEPIGGKVTNNNARTISRRSYNDDGRLQKSPRAFLNQLHINLHKLGLLDPLNLHTVRYKATQNWRNSWTLHLISKFLNSNRICQYRLPAVLMYNILTVVECRNSTFMQKSDITKPYIKQMKEAQEEMMSKKRSFLQEESRNVCRRIEDGNIIYSTPRTMRNSEASSSMTDDGIHSKAIDFLVVTLFETMMLSDQIASSMRYGFDLNQPDINAITIVQHSTPQSILINMYQGLSYLSADITRLAESGFYALLVCKHLNRMKTSMSKFASDLVWRYPRDTSLMRRFRTFDALTIQSGISTSWAKDSDKITEFLTEFNSSELNADIFLDFEYTKGIGNPQILKIEMIRTHTALDHEAVWTNILEGVRLCIIFINRTNLWSTGRVNTMLFQRAFLRAFFITLSLATSMSDPLAIVLAERILFEPKATHSNASSSSTLLRAFILERCTNIRAFIKNYIKITSPSVIFALKYTHALSYDFNRIVKTFDTWFQPNTCEANPANSKEHAVSTMEYDQLHTGTNLLQSNLFTKCSTTLQKLGWALQVSIDQSEYIYDLFQKTMHLINNYFKIEIHSEDHWTDLVHSLSVRYNISSSPGDAFFWWFLLRRFSVAPVDAIVCLLSHLDVDQTEAYRNKDKFADVLKSSFKVSIDREDGNLKFFKNAIRKHIHKNNSFKSAYLRNGDGDPNDQNPCSPTLLSVSMSSSSSKPSLGPDDSDLHLFENTSVTNAAPEDHNCSEDEMELSSDIINLDTVRRNLDFLCQGDSFVFDDQADFQFDISSVMSSNSPEPELNKDRSTALYSPPPLTTADKYQALVDNISNILTPVANQPGNDFPEDHFQTFFTNLERAQKNTDFTEASRAHEQLKELDRIISLWGYDSESSCLLSLFNSLLSRSLVDRATVARSILLHYARYMYLYPYHTEEEDSNTSAASQGFSIIFQPCEIVSLYWTSLLNAWGFSQSQTDLMMAQFDSLSRDSSSGKLLLEQDKSLSPFLACAAADPRTRALCVIIDTYISAYGLDKVKDDQFFFSIILSAVRPTQPDDILHNAHYNRLYENMGKSSNHHLSSKLIFTMHGVGKDIMQCLTPINDNSSLKLQVCATFCDLYVNLFRPKLEALAKAWPDDSFFWNRLQIACSCYTYAKNFMLETVSPQYNDK